jgi:hypothetical protein
MTAVATPVLSAIDNAFNASFEAIAKTLPFNPEWANGTGYFDHAVKGEHAPLLGVGEMVKSQDDAGRPLIIIGTPIGNVVVFRRYSKEFGRYTFNAPRNFEALMCHRICGLLREEDMATMLGDCYNGHWIRGNVGMLIRDMQSILCK